MILNITGNSFGTGSMKVPGSEYKGQETQDSTAGSGWQVDEFRFDQGAQELPPDKASMLSSLGIDPAQIKAGKTPMLVLGQDGKMSLQFTGGASAGTTSSVASSGDSASSGKLSWNGIEKALRQWGDMNAVSDDTVAQVKAGLGPVLEGSGIEFDHFKIKCDCNDPRGISAVGSDGRVLFEFQRNSSSCPSLMSFTLDELHNEWSALQKGTAGEESPLPAAAAGTQAPASRRKVMSEDRALEIAKAAIQSKGDIGNMPRSISDTEIREAYELLKNTKDGAAGSRSPQFYVGDELLTIDQVRNLSKAIGMLLL